MTDTFLVGRLDKTQRGRALFLYGSPGVFLQWSDNPRLATLHRTLQEAIETAKRLPSDLDAFVIDSPTAEACYMPEAITNAEKNPPCQTPPPGVISSHER